MECYTHLKCLTNYKKNILWRWAVLDQYLEAGEKQKLKYTLLVLQRTKVMMCFMLTKMNLQQTHTANMLTVAKQIGFGQLIESFNLMVNCYLFLRYTKESLYMYLNCQDTQKKDIHLNTQTHGIIAVGVLDLYIKSLILLNTNIKKMLCLLDMIYFTRTISVTMNHMLEKAELKCFGQQTVNTNLMIYLNMCRLSMIKKQYRYLKYQINQNISILKVLLISATTDAAVLSQYLNYTIQNLLNMLLLIQQAIEVTQL